MDSSMDMKDKAISVLSVSLAIACELLADSMVVDEQREDLDNGETNPDVHYDQLRAEYYMRVGAFILSQASDVIGLTENEVASMEEFFLIYLQNKMNSGAQNDESEVRAN